MKEDKQIRTSRPRGGGPGRGLAPGEKPQNLRKAIADIVRYMGGYRLVVALVMLLAAASTVFQVIGPKVMGMASATPMVDERPGSAPTTRPATVPTHMISSACGVTQSRIALINRSNISVPP